VPAIQQVETGAMRRAAGRATALLRALANADRLLLLCQLTHGEKCVGDLEAQLDIRQPTLSQQLGVLRRERLVSTRREGKRIYYRIRNDEVGRVLQSLYSIYCRG